ncbi:MAG: S8 family serine peptidase [Actinomycetota bacterium]
MSGRGRIRMHVVGILVMVGVLALPGSPAVPASADSTRAVIDPVLLSNLDSLGSAPAILTFDRTKVDRSEVAAYLEANGFQAQVFDHLSVALACASTTKQVEALAAAPGAVSVWGDHPLTPALDKSVLTAFNGDPSTVWEGVGVTGKDVSIGVIDTGVDATHPDIKYGPRVKLNVRVLVGDRDMFGPYTDPCAGTFYSPQLQDSEGTSGHGTHLTSVAAGDGTVSGGRYTGVAPGADIIGVGVADTLTPQVAVDQYTQLSLLGVMAGINYVISTGLEGCRPPLCPEFVPINPAKVILAGWTQDGLHDPWHPMTFVLRDLAWYGITVVFPVGNEGPTPSDCSAAATCHFNPFAAGPEAIGVAATPKKSRGSVEAYSSRGDPVPREARGETFRYEPFLSAPGTGVIAARRPGFAHYAQPPGSILGAGPDLKQVGVDRRYVALSGTSVAAAHVAGAIALMQSAALKGSGCFLTSAQVMDILRSTADPISGYDRHLAGAGAIDVTAAVNASRGGGPFSPDPWMCPPAS